MVVKGIDVVLFDGRAEPSSAHRALAEKTLAASISGAGLREVRRTEFVWWLPDRSNRVFSINADCEMP